jgi:hypothetical protein
MTTQNFVTLPSEVVNSWLLKAEWAGKRDLADSIRAALTEQAQPLEFNGLTKEETDASMSVRGLSKKVQPAQGEVDWAAVGRIIDAHNSRGPLMAGTSNWGAMIYRTALLQSNAERVPLTRNKKQAMWVAATIDLPSQENCYLRGIVDAENAHNITKGQQ